MIFIQSDHDPERMMARPQRWAKGCLSFKKGNSDVTKELYDIRLYKDSRATLVKYKMVINLLYFTEGICII